jgi:NAD(P)-dependent dehydrogenase (short-subunit alcohol dehydrogenase family)
MPKTPDYFHAKTIIITGAGGGIGHATALIFAREGANVVCAEIDPLWRCLGPSMAVAIHASTSCPGGQIGFAWLERTDPSQGV